MTICQTVTSTKSISAYKRFVEKMKSSEYSFDNFIYTYTIAKGIVTCKTHGEFLMSPNDLLHNHGCPKCGRERTLLAQRMTTSSFIKKARAKHGDKFDYSLTVYGKCNTEPVTVVCPVHGPFSTTPNNHLTSGGCKECGYKTISKNKTKSIDKVIEQFKLVHKDTYDYSKVVYTKTNSPVTIICKKHGEFNQRPSNHLQGQGCLKCRNTKIRKRHFKEPTILYYIYFPKLKLYKVGVTMKRIGISKRFKNETNSFKVLAFTVFKTGRIAYKLEQFILNRIVKEPVKTNGPLIDGNSETFIKPIEEKWVKRIFNENSVLRAL